MADFKITITAIDRAKPILDRLAYLVSEKRLEYTSPIEKCIGCKFFSLDTKFCAVAPQNLEKLKCSERESIS